MPIRIWANAKQAFIDATNRWVADANASSNEIQRATITGITILSSQICTVILLIYNIGIWFWHPEPGYFQDILSDLICLAILLVLGALNRKGHTSWSANILLVFVASIPSIVFPNQTLERVLLIYGIPIVASSFMVKPGFSFLYTILVILGYTANYLYYRPAYEYNVFVPVISLFTAVIACLASMRWDQVLQHRRRREIAYQTLVETSPDAITVSDLDGRITMVNQRTLEIHGYTDPDELIGRSAMDLIAREDWQRAGDNISRTLALGRIREIRYSLVRKDGTTFPGEISIALMKDTGGKPDSFMAISRDISDLKKAEDDLRASERYWRQISEGIREYLWLQDSKTGRFLYASPALLLLWGKSLEEINLHPQVILDQFHPQDRPALEQAYEKMVTTGHPANFEARMIHPEGDDVWIWARIYPVRDEKGVLVRYSGIAEDITQRKWTERALIQSEEKFSRAFYISPDAITINRVRDRMFLEINQGYTRLTGYAREEVVGKTAPEAALWVDPADEARLVEMLRENGECHNLEAPFRLKDGRIRTGLLSARMIEIGGEKCVLAITRDIHDQKLAELALKNSLRRIEQQVKRLTALRQIDTVILANFDLRRAMEEILSTVQQALEADAARLLVPDQNEDSELAHCFNTLAWVGELRPCDVEQSRAICPRAAMQAAETGQAVYRFHSDGQAAECETFPRCGSTDCEPTGFAAHACVPLLLKGALKGVLEVFYKNPQDIDPEWREFFGSLSMQLTIAIHNAELFDQMENAANDLAAAYEETIAGWSHALELRDKETQGHSDRVTELTVRLARMLGISDEAMLHLRRGVLLHDIGKMGIPDHILLKPGPLTEDEWTVMRQHPVYARDLLEPIPYLAQAVEIPYCHHEKWDGTGYPCGLKGEQIPLAARIFAVVDVWDALTSDRPYRGRWPEQKVWDYLFAQSGKQFDPAVVAAFARLMKGGTESQPNSSSF